MALNNINLSAYAFNPFGALSQGLSTGEQLKQQAQLNALKRQMIQSQIAQMPQELQNATANAALSQARADSINALKPYGYTKPTPNTEYGIRMMINSGLISQDEGQKLLSRLQAQDAYKAAETQSLLNPFRTMNSFQKELYSSQTGNLTPSNYTGNLNNIVGMNNNGSQNALNLNPDQQELIRNASKRKIEKETGQSAINTQIDYSNAFESVANQISDEALANAANAKKRAEYFYYDQALKLSPNMQVPQDYLQFKQLPAQMRTFVDMYIKSVRGSVAASNKKTIDKLLDPNWVTTNPKAAVESIRSLQKSVETEKQALQKNANTAYSQETPINTNPQMKLSFRSADDFKDKQDFINYLRSLSKEQRDQYRSRYGG